MIHSVEIAGHFGAGAVCGFVGAVLGFLLTFQTKSIKPCRVSPGIMRIVLLVTPFALIGMCPLVSGVAVSWAAETSSSWINASAWAFVFSFVGEVTACCVADSYGCLDVKF